MNLTLSRPDLTRDSRGTFISIFLIFLRGSIPAPSAKWSLFWGKTVKQTINANFCWSSLRGHSPGCRVILARQTEKFLSMPSPCTHHYQDTGWLPRNTQRVFSTLNGERKDFRKIAITSLTFLLLVSVFSHKKTFRHITRNINFSCSSVFPLNIKAKGLGLLSSFTFFFLLLLRAIYYLT